MTEFIPTIILAIVVLGALAYYVGKNRKDEVEKPNPKTEPVQETQKVSSLVGNYHFNIVPPDAARWGQGIHPDEKAGKAEARGDWAKGLIYRLGGDGYFARSESGIITGKATIYGHEIPINIQVPVNGRAVGFTDGGASFEFHFSELGVLTGKVWEPHDPDNKYGNVTGAKS